MAVAGLVLGILSVTVLWWLGFFLGGLWTAGASVSTIMAGGPVAVEAWRIWTLGIGVGVVVPLIAVGLGIGGVKKGQTGIGIAGIVTGGLAAVLGLAFTILSAFALNVAESVQSQTDPVNTTAEMEKMTKTLDDPAFQEQMLKAMQAAADKGGAVENAAAAENAAAGETGAGDKGAAPAAAAEVPSETTAGDTASK